MSTGELRRAEVLARLKSGTLRLVDAGKTLELSYRQHLGDLVQLDGSFYAWFEALRRTLDDNTKSKQRGHF